MICTDKRKKIISLLLVALYLIFYAGTFSFNHTHVYPWGTIVHSHPYSSANHTHTINAIQLINSFSNLLYIVGTAVFCFAFLPVAITLFSSVATPHVISRLTGCNQLRAPPIPA